MGGKESTWVRGLQKRTVLGGQRGKESTWMRGLQKRTVLGGQKTFYRRKRDLLYRENSLILGKRPAPANALMSYIFTFYFYFLFLQERRAGRRRRETPAQTRSCQSS